MLYREYAEAIEGRLKRLGLLVDLLFPNPDVPIGKVLANIASRGCLFAIVITPQNLEMRSATVNLLYGQPAEHRNMPVDDAVELIFKNFEQLMRHGDNTDMSGDIDDSQSQFSSVPQSNIRHPDSVHHLINLLAENRCLTVLQYDCVIKYLQERRDIQYKNEIGDSAEDLLPNNQQQSHQTQPGVSAEEEQEKELQKRIMDILNKPSITSLHTDSPLPRTSNQNDWPYNRQSSTQPSTSRHDKQEPQLLNDPKVQKALDSLLSNNSFNF